MLPFMRTPFKMGFRLTIIFVLVALAAIVADSWSFVTLNEDVFLGTKLRTASSRDMDGLDEVMLGSDAKRRNLGQADYISYAALSKNSVPCNKRGQSYYNCQQPGKANPYRRGCTAVTQCARRQLKCTIAQFFLGAPLIKCYNTMFHIIMLMYFSKIFV